MARTKTATADAAPKSRAAEVRDYVIEKGVGSTFTSTQVREQLGVSSVDSAPITGALVKLEEKGVLEKDRTQSPHLYKVVTVDFPSRASGNRQAARQRTPRSKSAYGAWLEQGRKFEGKSNFASIIKEVPDDLLALEISRRMRSKKRAA